MEQLRARLEAGMTERGVAPDIQDQIWNKLVAFANYGFPESHSISFAYLVYASSWLKLHYPAAFCAALLRAQPMGFYSPHSLVQDARRHGVPTLGPDVNASLATASLEETASPGRGAERVEVSVPGTDAAYADMINAERRDHGWAVRLGVGSVRTIGEELAETIEANRPYVSIEDLARRAGLKRDHLEALATAGALDCFDGTGDRRSKLWTAGAVAESGDHKLPGIVTGVEAPQLPGMSERDEALADLWATGVAADGHPTVFLRQRLDDEGVIPAVGLSAVEHGTKVLVAGVITHRQRPATASGTTFIGMEDETGLINVVVSVGCWARYRKVVRSAPALLVRGRCERQGAVVNIVAEKLEPLAVHTGSMSRDFR